MPPPSQEKCLSERPILACPQLKAALQVIMPFWKEWGCVCLALGSEAQGATGDVPLGSDVLGVLKINKKNFGSGKPLSVFTGTRTVHFVFLHAPPERAFWLAWRNSYTNQKAIVPTSHSTLFTIFSWALHCMCFLNIYAQRLRVQVIEAWPDVRWEDLTRGVDFWGSLSLSSWWTSFCWSLWSRVHLASAYVDHRSTLPQSSVSLHP